MSIEDAILGVTKKLEAFEKLTERENEISAAAQFLAAFYYDTGNEVAWKHAQNLTRVCIRIGAAK